MVEIKRRGSILYIVYDGIQKFLSQRDPAIELGYKIQVKVKLSSDVCYIGHSEQGKFKLKDQFLEILFVLLS